MGEVLEVRLAGERFRVAAEDEAPAAFWRGPDADGPAVAFAARHARPGWV